MPRVPNARLSIFMAVSLPLVACNRTEEPQSSAGARPPAAHSTAETLAEPGPKAVPAEPASAAPAQCVVPMPNEPPADAPKAPECPPDSEERPVLPRGAVTFIEASGRPHVEVELARTHRHRERGLMFRTELARDTGMLFSWDDERVRSFWMKNTCIPLDMLFITADGTIAGVLEQVPVLNTSSRSVPCPAMHVLELNAGWVRAHGVRAGQKLRIED